jgi:capsular polysaccharide transport system permease protein
MTTNEKRISDWQAARAARPVADAASAKAPGASERSAQVMAGLESVRRSMEEERTERKRKLVTRLFLFLGIPLVAIFAYASFIAQPLYAGEAVFTVQTTNSSAPAPNAGFFSGTSSSSTINDAFKTRAFILSRPMMNHMEKEYGFLSHFASGMDPLTRLGGMFGIRGDPLEYYRKRVIVTVDVQEGILRLYVHGRTREDAVRFGQGILDAAEKHVNESSALIGNDQIAQLTNDVQQAEDALSQARGEFTGVKAQQGDLNPERTAEVVYNLISNLELELAEAVRQRQGLMRDGLVDSPLLPPIEARISELRSQIGQNRARLSNPGGRSLAQTVSAFDSANSRQEMAQVRWQGALSTLRDAYLDVLRDRRYFVLVVGMSSGETAKVRDWTAIVLPILIILAIAAGIVFAIRRLAGIGGRREDDEPELAA